MAVVKVFLLAFLACSALARTEAAELGFRNERNIIEGFDKLVEQHKQMIEEALGIYENILKEIFEEVSGNIHDHLIEALQELSKKVQEALKHLQELQAQGKNVKECIIKHLPEVISLVQKTQETQTACVQDSIHKIEEIHDKLVAELAGVREDVAEVIGNIQKCKDRDCLKENGAKLIELVGVVKGKVREAIMEAVNVIQETSPEAIDCIKAASDNFVNEMKSIHDSIVACIKA